ncbi:tetratricopeptide repeat protein [Streptomyces sp. NPDC051639]|uniref:tetratricopeptide repeat protein n=1 Tax=Streptomyces sp. NPDC051639 TaxID=3155671 RepID=UPI003413A026
MIDAELQGLLERAHSAIQEEEADLLNVMLPQIQELADSGNPYFQEVIGAAALEIEKDYAKAYRYLKLAANARISSAQRGLGHMLALGLGVAKDLEMAAALFRKAADAGDPFAKYNLANMYLQGMGVPKSEEKGTRLLEEASAVGLPAASAQLADMKGAIDDYEGARGILEKIVPDGEIPPLSAKNFSAMCYHGIGGPVDKIKALGGALKTAELGDRGGLDSSRTIAGELTMAEIKESIAWSKVDDWAEAFLGYARDRGN